MSRMRITMVAVLAMLMLLLGFAGASNAGKEPEGRGLFSWKSDVFDRGGTELFAFMKENGFTELYQSISGSLDNETVTEFLQNAQKERIEVYLLTGDPRWALDPLGQSMCETIAKGQEIRRAAPGGLKGIMIDVEPYTLDAWDENAEEIMESFVSGLKAAYSMASEHNFEFIVCIPYHYDDNGFVSELKSIIRTGCDRVAVMNYYKGSESRLIENELRYIQRYNKKIINIYEFKEADGQGIQDINTYHKEGFKAALASAALVSADYPDTNIVWAAHDYETLKNILP